MQVVRHLVKENTLSGGFLHAAEHTMRHVGQLMVTAAVIKENKAKK